MSTTNATAGTVDGTDSPRVVAFGDDAAVRLASLAAVQDGAADAATWAVAYALMRIVQIADADQKEVSKARRNRTMQGPAA